MGDTNNLLHRNVPGYMYEKSNLVRLILFTAAFALIFINIYKPFSSDNWYPVSDFMFFAYSSLVILTGVLVVVVCRVLMYRYGKSRPITYGKYAGWILAEIFFMSLFYTLYTLYINDDRDVWQTFQDSVTNTSLVLLLPYSVCLLYFSWKEKDVRLQQLAEEKEEGTGKQSVYAFHDEKGELRLTVLGDHLLSVESADNYVIVWYLHKGKAARFVLRNTLKALEGQFAETSLQRCHRSYMVNLDQVCVIRREKEGVFLELGIEQFSDIPLSKTYSERVMRWFF